VDIRPIRGLLAGSLGVAQPAVAATTANEISGYQLNADEVAASTGSGDVTRTSDSRCINPGDLIDATSPDGPTWTGKDSNCLAGWVPVGGPGGLAPYIIGIGAYPSPADARQQLVAYGGDWSVVSQSPSHILQVNNSGFVAGLQFARLTRVAGPLAVAADCSAKAGSSASSELQQCVTSLVDAQLAKLKPLITKLESGAATVTKKCAKAKKLLAKARESGSRKDIAIALRRVTVACRNHT
jgi:hypothetical protein